MGDTVGGSTHVEPRQQPGQEVSPLIVDNAPAELRPGYPMVCVDWLCGVTPIDVVDVGCGDGRLTETLTFYGHRVTGLDVDAESLVRLQENLPSVATFRASAEETGLPSSSFDVAVFAQSWHHVDPAKTAHELLRILRPDGRVALAWNVLNREVAWARELQELMHSLGDSVPADGLDAYPAPRFPDAFGPWESTTFTWSHQVSLHQLRELPTHRTYYLQASPEQQTAIRDRVNALIDQQFSGRPDTDPIEVPYVTVCHRTQRRA